jgi:alpha-2-macroglobulin
VPWVQVIAWRKCGYVLPQAYVEDMYRPDRFGRTGTGVIEVEPAR